MKFIVVFIAVVNGLAIAVGSVLSIRGDGGEQYGVWLVLVVGGSWVAITTWIAFKFCAKGNGFLGVAAVAVTIPVAVLTFAILVSLVEAGGELLGRLQPMPSAVVEACKTASQRFISDPKQPMRSLVFDWKTSLGRPRPGHIRVTSKMLVTDAVDVIGFPGAVGFVERVDDLKAIHHPDTEPSYWRKPNGGSYSKVEGSQADALVQYEIHAVPTDKADRVFDIHEISVRERLSANPLATMKFVIKSSDSNPVICGETAPGQVNVGEFILKAMGIVPK
jgi:hypothetical protein